MKMDEYYESKGYKRISKDSVSSLDDPIHHGIKIQKAGYGRELFKIKPGNNGPNINVKTLNSKGYVVKTP